ncbi:MAG: hypothetical protein UT84_C0001G0003 [Candidatus Curtissbacteria bacterium GW2011_GWA1_40_16]|uniref:Uncharacterized protein n=1 Tax=Candidatus Curtissbacteria bacterium GW2011_GWA1_40_16 TaxID=1618405 RepID=A0A0G0RFT7_9BACT|nr:MAG: hypothetical protein UT84_C0001G0003 [Candidatus Curtissbacteria bacterium GW2011_GWA1_40_16]
MAKEWKGMNCNASGGAVYGLGLIGALIYFLQHATTLTQGLVGIFKAIFWPAYFVYNVFEFLKL